MKLPALLTLLLAALLAALPTRHVHAQAQEASFDVFYNNLADDGDWYNTSEFGYVWHPAIADGGEKWRPYTDGYWAETDDGWTWVSYESFGWATYHYGRWARLKDIGWAWVPGYQWGPGWVSWRTSDDYVGWAPLPPRSARAGAVTVDYNDVEAADDGYTAAVDQDYDIGPDNYCFVQTGSFGAPVLAEVILPRERNLLFVENTINVTNIYYRRGPERTVVYNSGPNFAFIDAHVSHPIQRLRIDRRDDLAYLRDSHHGGGNPTVVRNGVLLVAAPLIARHAVNFEQVKPVRIKQTITQTQLNHGWTSAGGDPQHVQALRERIRTQSVAAPRQARADMPPQNIGPSPEAVIRDRQVNTVPGGIQEGNDHDARHDGQRDKPGRDQTRVHTTVTTPPSNPTVTESPRDTRREQRVQPGTPNPQIQQGVQPPKDKDARRLERDQQLQQQAQQDELQAQKIQRDRASRHTDQPQVTQPTEPSQPTRDGRRELRGQPTTQGQDVQSGQSPVQNDRATRRLERQQTQTVQPTAPQTQPQTPQTQGQQDRNARRLERQQTQTVAPPAQQTQPQPPPTQGQPTQTQGQQDHAARRAERQQQPTANPQPSGDDDKKKKHDN